MASNKAIKRKFQLSTIYQYVSPTFLSSGYIIQKICYADIELSGKTTTSMQESSNKNRSVTKRENPTSDDAKQENCEIILVDLSSFFQTIYIMKYTNEMTGNCSKLIMEGFYVDGGVFLASRTSSPFRSMAGLNHRAS